MKKNQKRILTVTLKKMLDESPDTSYLGEYGNSAQSDYAIDRDHSLDCNSVTFSRDSKAQLERVENYLNSQQYSEELPEELRNDAAEALEVVQDTLADFEECDCSGGDRERNEYRFFNPNYENYKGCPEEEIRKYCVQDYERMESLNRGQWCYIGIWAEAEVQLSKDGVIQELSSGGLRGIESDSGNDYLSEVEQEELSQLRKELREIGFSARAISSAFKNVEHKEA